MRERLSDYQEKYGDLYNLEATPAESTSYRLAKIDKKKYPEIITANEMGDTYYTNSSHLPVGYTDDIFSALDIQDQLQTLYTSGTVFHAFLGERLPDWKAAASLVRKIAENYRLPYYTMSPTYSVCAEHGYLSGEQDTCPYCGRPTEVYSRITGYYRPVQNWNKGKAQEFLDRKTYAFAGLGNYKEEAKPVKEVKQESEKAESLLLFTTKTCPNCKIVKDMLGKKGIEYTIVDAEENVDECNKFEVNQAPTLIAVTKDGYEKYANASNIIKYINRN
jgi:ribonucleoside-triphosphate reductase